MTISMARQASKQTSKQRHRHGHAGRQLGGQTDVPTDRARLTNRLAYEGDIFLTWSSKSANKTHYKQKTSTRCSKFKALNNNEHTIKHSLSLKVSLEQVLVSGSSTRFSESTFWRQLKTVAPMAAKFCCIRIALALLIAIAWTDRLTDRLIKMSYFLHVTLALTITFLSIPVLCLSTPPTLADHSRWMDRQVKHAGTRMCISWTNTQPSW